MMGGISDSHGLKYYVVTFLSALTPQNYWEKTCFTLIKDWCYNPLQELKLFQIKDVVKEEIFIEPECEKQSKSLRQWRWRRSLCSHFWCARETEIKKLSKVFHQGDVRRGGDERKILEKYLKNTRKYSETKLSGHPGALPKARFLHPSFHQGEDGLAHDSRSSFLSNPIVLFNLSNIFSWMFFVANFIISYYLQQGHSILL